MILVYYLLFGLTSFFAWNFIGPTFIIALFFFFKIIDDAIKTKWYIFLIRILLLILIFNISVTFWLFKVNFQEAFFAIVGNTIVLSIPLLVTYLLIKLCEFRFIYTFTPIWVLSEILHSNWDFAWPWLTFGNVLGNFTSIIQWYSIFGVYSGSIWLICCSYSLYSIFFLKKYKNGNFIKKASSLLLTPIIVSLVIYITQLKQNYRDKIKITTYQPKISNDTDYQKSKKLYKKLLDFKSEKFIICPEIFLTNLNTETSKQNLHFIDKFIKLNPEKIIVLGVERKYKSKRYNTILIKNKDGEMLRIKQCFVPVREYSNHLTEKITKEPSYYCKNKADNSLEIKNKFNFTPLICYESIFSFFSASKSKGSQFITLSTSEKFMNNSIYGKKQYLNIVRIRAIENRKFILKCSYDGISCVIDNFGNVKQTINSELENVTLDLIDDDSIYQKIISVL